MAVFTITIEEGIVPEIWVHRRLGGHDLWVDGRGIHVALDFKVNGLQERHGLLAAELQGELNNIVVCETQGPNSDLALIKTSIVGSSMLIDGEYIILHATHNEQLFLIESDTDFQILKKGERIGRHYHWDGSTLSAVKYI